jgi:hypothetical protein
MSTGLTCGPFPALRELDEKGATKSRQVEEAQGDRILIASVMYYMARAIRWLARYATLGPRPQGIARLVGKTPLALD